MCSSTNVSLTAMCNIHICISNIHMYIYAGDIAGNRGHGRLGNCHQFRKQRHALSCRGSREKNFLDRGSHVWYTKMWMHRDGSHLSPRPPERLSHVRRLSLVPGLRLQRPEGSVDGAAAATMSGKKATEKVSEIDAHINKQYDIVRRLGKGVITLSSPFILAYRIILRTTWKRVNFEYLYPPCEIKIRGLTDM